MPSQLPRPTGIVIEIAFPRWLVRIGRVSIAAWLVGVLAFMVFAVAVATWSGGVRTSSSTGPSLAVTGTGFGERPITYEVRVSAGSEAAKDLDKEWTLLMTSGAIHWANVVEGPTKLASGESASLTLTFLFEPMATEGEPVALRWDPSREVTASIPLGPQ